MAEFKVPVHEHKRSYSCSDCHKSFLRSEHLSRHRLNHRPKQVFSCTKCPKEFVRSDLLQRHMKRHEKGMHYRSTGGVVRAKLEESSPPSEKEESPVSSEPQILNVLEDFYPTPIVQPANEYPEAIDSSVAAAPAAAIEKQASFIDPSLQDFDFGLSKVNPFFFDASAEFQDVPSDMDWFFGDVLQDTPSAHEYESGSEPVYHPHLQPKDSSILSSEESPWVTVSSKLRSSLGGLSQDVLDSQWFLPSNLAGFYELYFINYHPHFPIFHRPTMVPAEIPPLLLAAIITLGSTLSPDSALFEITTKVHDHLRWWVCKNETLEPPAPLWCLQALLLIQAHGKMFSTRRHHELAHIFHGAIITLMRRGSAYTTTRATEKEHSTTMERSWRQWAESESSRRTAFFAFIMDAQHSSLFGHTPVLSVSDIRLSLPCPDSQWDASSPEVWAELDRQSGEPLHFLPVLRSLLGKHPVPASCSAYSRFILLHGLYSITFNLQAKDSSTLGVGTGRLMSAESSTPLIEDWREIIDRAIDTWSFSLLSQTSSLCLDAARPLYRMAHVSIYTSIMDIHIVAGAPSLLGNLLSTSDRSKANSRIRAWSEKAEARKALNHSLLLIQEILFTGRKYIAREDNISLRPWCLYHATLVVWAYGFVTEGRVDHEPVIGAEEYLVGMRTAMVGSVREVKGANRTKGLILTVRESLEDCRWELLQEAYSTLGRLVDIIPSTPSR